MGDELVPALGVRGDERVVHGAPLDEALDHRVGEGDVAPGTHRHVQVAQLRAEHRRLDRRRHPVLLEPWLQVRVDDHDLRAAAPWPGRGTS